jgi:Flp pilus assembly protein TadG
MIKLSPCLKRMFTSRQGNVSIVFALASPLVIGSAALSVETSYWYYKHHQLQAAADNAAKAAGHELRNGSSPDVVKAAALYAAGLNGYDNSIGTINVAPPTSGPYANVNSAVQVTLTQTQQRFFTQVFSKAPVVAEANATANWQTTADACILALNPSAAQAAYFNGSANLTLNGCVVMSDSGAANGVFVWGAASLTASCIVSAGGVQTKTGGINDTGCVKPEIDAPPAPDPYKNLAWPTTVFNTPCVNASGNNYSPGIHYCSLDIGPNDINLPAGQYMFDSVTGHGNGSLTGSGVTLFTGSGGVDINGKTTLDLSGPTSGADQGIVFFGSRSASAAVSVNGTNSSLITGALYFPNQQVNYQGNFSGVNGCTQIVADTVVFTGNATFNVNCGTNGPPPVTATTSVTLVG